MLKELIEEDPQWSTTGNYIYLDVLSALRWIMINIPDYGGDPNNVSVFGQGAGRLSVIGLGSVHLYRTNASQSSFNSLGNYLS